MAFAFYTEGTAPVYYFYETNLQGDVVAIYDSNGAKVVSFTYDAWGNFTTNVVNSTVCTTEFLAASLFRYRSYIYDYESGLYYLQSRYYDPETGRFINADNQMSLRDTLGTNLFVYCCNNPVNRIDPTGEAWWHWALGAAIVAACAVATVVTCGGFAAAASAVCLVANGIAATTTASTIAAAAFVSSATVYGCAVLSAASESNSVEEFNEKGNWGTVFSTAIGTISGAIIGWNLSGQLPRGSSNSQASYSPISQADARRIQNATSRTHQRITVVGSRANGTAGANSDWDYVMYGNSAQRHSAVTSIPRGVCGGGNSTGIDIFSAYPGSPIPVKLDESRPHIDFFP